MFRQRRVALLVGAFLAVGTLGQAQHWQSDPKLGGAIGFEIHEIPMGARLYLGKTEVPAARIDPTRTARFQTHDVAEEFVLNDFTFTLRVDFSTPDRGQRSWTREVKARAGQRVLLSLGPNQPTPSPEVVDENTTPINSTAQGTSARLRLVVTLDTRVFINGHLTLQEGEVRDFETPALTPGQTYSADIKFDFRNKTGRRIIRTHSVQLHAGQRLEINELEELVERLPE